MRLLNVYTFKFAEFEGKNIPPYAVASHRWCDDEATYVDVLENKNTESAGFKKIRGFCDFTKTRNERHTMQYVAGRGRQKIEWIWIDTCCIDRRSSAEIAENITSMYKYYERSEECYAYLADVTATRRADGTIINDRSEFARSSWFTRGWTLQELLAPSHVLFLSSDWTVLGHKCSQGIQSNNHVPGLCRHSAWSGTKDVLNYLISDISGISSGVLGKSVDPRTMRPDEICKWIENRETKKEEDLAYCLLGLFGVFMVPNYGEGENA
jgi:hypothetical protein